jgi:hypothetical protein
MKKKETEKNATSGLDKTNRVIIDTRFDKLEVSSSLRKAVPVKIYKKGMYRF